MAALLAGCAGHDVFTKKMDGYIGKPIDSAIASIGEGYNQRTLADGSKLVFWSWYEPGVTPGYRAQDIVVGRGAIVIPGEAPQFDRRTAGLCEITFLADATGTIRDWRVFGDNCRGRVR